MSNNIYLFKTQRINMFEMAGVQIIKNAPDRFYNICDYYLDDKFLKIKTLGEIVTNFLPFIDGNYRNFRNVNWDESLDYLDRTVNQAFAEKKHIMFGTNSLDQFNFLIDHYADKCKTLVVTYREESYDQLLDHLVDHHIYLLKTSGIEIRDQDYFNLKNLNDTELKEYYKKSFQEQNLLPKAFDLDADYTLDFKELFDPVKFSDWLTRVGFPFSEQSKKFYQGWLAANLGQ